MMLNQYQHSDTSYIELINQTYSYCPECLEVIPSRIINKDGKVFLQKECTIDGFSETLIENDVKFYKKIIKYVKNDPDVLKFANVPLDGITNEKLIYNEIMIYLTSKCNLNCPICFLETKINEVPFDIIKKLAICRRKWIILSGGEPTLREDLPKIISEIVKSNNIPIIQTNGLKLSDFEYTKRLRKAGLKFVHFSFNGFDPVNYKDLYGNENLLGIKLTAIENLNKLGFRVFLSMALVEGMEENIKETLEFVAKNRGCIKGIFLRPVYPTRGMNDFCTITLSDVIRMTERATNKKITEGDFIGFKRLRWNIYSLVKRILGKRTAKGLCPDIRLGLPLKVRKERYEPIFNHKKLNRLNNMLENSLEENNRVLFLLKLIKSVPSFFALSRKNFIFLLFSVLKNGFDRTKIKINTFDKKDIIHVWIDMLQGPRNVDLSMNIDMYRLVFKNGERITLQTLYAA